MNNWGVPVYCHHRLHHRRERRWQRGRLVPHDTRTRWTCRDVNGAHTVYSVFHLSARRVKMLLIFKKVFEVSWKIPLLKILEHTFPTCNIKNIQGACGITLTGKAFTFIHILCFWTAELLGIGLGCDSREIFRHAIRVCARLAASVSVECFLACHAGRSLLWEGYSGPLHHCPPN